MPTTNEKRKQGKSNRAKGKRFEILVRKDLEKKGWIIFKNPNQVSKPELNTDGNYTRKFQSCKPMFIGGRILMMTGGFPDYLCIKETPFDDRLVFNVHFVECKGGDETHKYLNEEEKFKCMWIEANLKMQVLIAQKGEKRGEIIYKRWNE